MRSDDTDSTLSSLGWKNSDNEEELDFRSVGLHGRCDELESLKNAFVRAAKGQAHLALVHGVSGIGKTALVDELREFVISHEGRFVSGKFDQLRNHHEPYSALVEAFTDLVDLILQSDDSARMQQLLIQNFGDEIEVMTQFIYNLRHLIGSDPESSYSSSQPFGSAFFTRFKILCRLFLRTLATPRIPLVLFLDDIQWSDRNSLDIIHYLIKDVDLKHTLIICSYRDEQYSQQNQEGDEKNLFDALFSRETIALPILDIHVKALDLDSIARIIARLMRMEDPNQTLPLANIVLSKTCGNPHFVLQFFDLLHRAGMIYFDETTAKWLWDLDRVRSETNVSANVAELVAHKLQGVRKDVQNVLMLASCLGHSFNTDFLSILYGTLQNFRSQLLDQTPIPFLKILIIAEKEGLIECLGHNKYKFSHDSFQQVLSSQLEEREDCDDLKLQIGQMAKDRIGEDQHMLYHAVNNLNAAHGIVTNENERIELARLNFSAAKMALSKFALRVAAKYMRAGLGLLGESKWSHHYELTLELASACAEVEYSIGNIEESQLLANEIVEKSKSLLDKMGGYFILIDMLGDQGRIDESEQLCVKVLKEIGSRFVSRFSLTHVLKAILTCWRTIDSKSDAELLNLVQMEDPNKIAMMALMGRIICYGFYKEDFLKRIFSTILDMAVMTAKYGKSSNTLQTFALYSMLKATVGRYKHAYRHGRLCLKLLDCSSEKKESEPLVLWTVNAFSLHWKEPLQNTVEPLRRAHSLGLQTGNVRVAFQAAFYHAVTSSLCSTSLYEVEEFLNGCCKQVKEYKCDTILCIMEPYLQLTYNFLGDCEYPAVLNGKAMNKTEIKERIKASKNHVASQVINFSELVLALHFESMKFAKTLIKGIEGKAGALEGTCLFYFGVFYCGMAHLLLFRLHGTRKNILKARTSMSRLRKWIRKGVTNCKPLYELLKAEYAVTRNSRTRVSFDSACHLANEHGFEHIEAFAYERAGVYASSMGNRIEAKAMVKKSMELYRKWGASAKTRWLEGQHFALLQEGRPVTLEVLVPVSRGMVEEDKSTEDTIETSNFRDRLGERNYTQWYRTIDG